MIAVNTSIWIGLRYLAGTRSRLLSVTAIISIFALALGVAVLILVMSVMNGLREELSWRLLGSVPHVELISSDLLQQPVTTVPIAGALAQARFLRFQALLSAGVQQGHAVTVFGVEPSLEPRLSLIPDHVVAGNWQLLGQHKRGLVLGRPLADYLGLFIGDKVNLLVLEQLPNTLTPKPKQLTFVVVALFQMNAEVDYKLAFVALNEALKELSPAAWQGGWRLKLPDAMAAPQQGPQLLRQVTELTGIRADLRTWADTFGALFQAVHLEKRIMFVLLLLVVLIAAVGVASAQMSAVDQKRSAVAVLCTMGMTQLDIALIFLVQGMVIGLTGIVLGIASGILLASHISAIVGWAEELVGANFLTAAFFAQLPSKWQASDVALIATVALILVVVFTLYPALIAARIKPARVLNSLT